MNRVLPQYLWVQVLPSHRKLSSYKNKAHVFKDSAIKIGLYKALEEAKSAVERHVPDEKDWVYLLKIGGVPSIRLCIFPTVAIRKVCHHLQRALLA